MELQKVRITKIFKKEEVSQKTGKPYTRPAIQTTEHGKTWISGFQNQQNSHWQEDDEVEILIKPNGKYMNFELPKAQDRVMNDMQEIRTELKDIKGMLAQLLYADTSIQTPKTGSVTEFSDDELKPDTDINLPF